MKYFTNGTVDDPSGTGLTLAVFQTAADGNVPEGTYLGYLAKEITEKEYLMWLDRIANPDNKKYFHGAFVGVGVVDAKTNKRNLEKIYARDDEYIAAQVETNRINFKIAKRDAEAIGEDHEAVFTSKHPMVSEDVKVLLFADVRAAKTKAAKKAK